MIKRAKEGMRVRSIGYQFMTGVPYGMTGTVSPVATGRGKSVYPDPSRLMIFVKWDNGHKVGVFKKELEKV